MVDVSAATRHSELDGSRLCFFVSHDTRHLNKFIDAVITLKLPTSVRQFSQQRPSSLTLVPEVAAVWLEGQCSSDGEMYCQELSANV